MKKGGSSISSGRSESDKERTKMRERERRAITTKIFHGLRKYGDYQLSPRSDINQVLRELAKEAGWVVEPDGTTYRYKVLSRCPTCGVIPKTSTNTTPTTSSTVIACGDGGGGGGGGDCSTTTSPRCNIDPTMTMINPYNNNNSSAGITSMYGHEHASASSSIGNAENNNPLAFYMYNGLAGGLHRPSTATATVVGGGMKVQIPSQQQPQGTYIQEARASNQNTPAGSPLHLHWTN